MVERASGVDGRGNSSASGGCCSASVATECTPALARRSRPRTRGPDTCSAGGAVLDVHACVRYARGRSSRLTGRLVQAIPSVSADDPWRLLYAWSGSRGVNAVVTALVLAAVRPSLSAPSGDRTDPSRMRSVRACGGERVAGELGEESRLGGGYSRSRSPTRLHPCGLKRVLTLRTECVGRPRGWELALVVWSCWNFRLGRTPRSLMSRYRSDE